MRFRSIPVKLVLDQLKSGKQIERGYLGISIMPLNPQLARALKADVPPGTPIVAQVMPGTPAAEAGIEPYDVITEINGHKIKSPEELTQTVLQISVGKRAQAQIIRSGKPMTLDVAVTKRPETQRS